MTRTGFWKGSVPGAPRGVAPGTDSAGPIQG